MSDFFNISSIFSVYKLLTTDEWQDAQGQALWKGTVLDQSDGYIHLSTQTQWSSTAKLYFLWHEQLLLLTIATEPLTPHLVFEASRGGKVFPHLYAPLPLSAVSDVRSVRWSAAGEPFV